MAREESRSRRSVLTMGSGVLLASALPAQVQAQGAVALRHTTGFQSNPHVFYDLIEPASGATKGPMMLVHGGAHTGSCFLQTVDGRPGWAQYFAAMGHKVIIPDWPGVGRSGYVGQDQLTGELVCKGVGNLLQLFDRPVTVLTHSMSGPYGWKLLESHGEKISAVVAIAPGPPGNMQPAGEILSREGDTIEVKLQLTMKMNVKESFVAPRAFVDKKLIGDGTRFPREYADNYFASLDVVRPRLLYERVNIAGSQLQISNFASYKNKPVLVIVGTNDVDHPAEIDRPIVDWLNKNGAKGEFLQLSEKGITGNGHMMMIESNSDQIAKIIDDWIGRL